MGRWWPDLEKGWQRSSRRPMETQFRLTRPTEEILNEVFLSLRREIARKVYGPEPSPELPSSGASVHKSGGFIGPLQSGDVVQHEKWGPGTVISVFGEGDKKRGTD